MTIRQETTLHSICNASDDKFDIQKINKSFSVALHNTNLTADQRENDRIIMVNLNMIEREIAASPTSKIITLKDISNDSVNIRNINVHAYKWGFQARKDRALNSLL
jgi:hypothetical protein